MALAVWKLQYRRVCNRQIHRHRTTA